MHFTPINLIDRVSYTAYYRYTQTRSGVRVMTIFIVVDYDCNLIGLAGVDDGGLVGDDRVYWSSDDDSGEGRLLDLTDFTSDGILDDVPAIELKVEPVLFDEMGDKVDVMGNRI
jgi:hypothetical protein